MRGRGCWPPAGAVLQLRWLPAAAERAPANPAAWLPDAERRQTDGVCPVTSGEQTIERLDLGQLSIGANAGGPALRRPAACYWGMPCGLADALRASHPAPPLRWPAGILCAYIVLCRVIAFLGIRFLKS